MKLTDLEKILLRLGDFYLQYKNNKTEVIYIRNKNVEMRNINENPSILKYRRKSRDLYREQQNDGIVGTTLVNFLNISNAVKETLNRYLDVINKYDEKDIKTNEGIAKTHYELLDLTTNCQNVIISEINCFPLSVIIYKVFTNFKDDYQNMDLYKFMEDYKSKKDRSNYYSEMYKYLNKIINRTVERSKWFSKFSKKEMITIFIKSLILDIDFMILNSEKSIEKYPPNTNSDNCRIETLLDLFYVSKYHIQISRKELKICKNCNKYFITKFKRNEKYCRRKVKGYKYTCSELASKNYRGKSEYSNKRKDLSKAENKIYSMLRQRDKRKGTKDLEIFKNKQKSIYEEFKNNSNTEVEESQKKIDWINEEHEKLKRDK